MKMRITANRTVINGYKRKNGDIVDIDDIEFANKLKYYGIAEFLESAEKQDEFLTKAQYKKMSYHQLIKLAKEKGINAVGMKKEKIIEALTNGDN